MQRNKSYLKDIIYDILPEEKLHSTYRKGIMILDFSIGVELFVLIDLFNKHRPGAQDRREKR